MTAPFQTKARRLTSHVMASDLVALAVALSTQNTMNYVFHLDQYIGETWHATCARRKGISTAKTGMVNRGNLKCAGCGRRIARHHAAPNEV